MEDKIHITKEWLGSGSINFFGPQFSGKDTQCELLAEYYGGVKLSSGEILRAHHAENPNLKEEMNEGNLAPTDDFHDIVLPYFSKDELQGRPLLLSSVGRMKGEEPAVFESTASGGHPIKAVVVLELPFDEIKARFEHAKLDKDRGERADDNLESLQRRLELYQQQTLPVIDFYREKGLVITIDGTKSREEVTEDIIEALYQKSLA